MVHMTANSSQYATSDRIRWGSAIRGSALGCLVALGLVNALIWRFGSPHFAREEAILQGLYVSSSVVGIGIAVLLSVVRSSRPRPSTRRTVLGSIAWFAVVGGIVGFSVGSSLPALTVIGYKSQIFLTASGIGVAGLLVLLLAVGTAMGAVADWIIGGRTVRRAQEATASSLTEDSLAIVKNPGSPRSALPALLLLGLSINSLALGCFCVHVVMSHTRTARNLQSIHLALMSYQADHGQLPPATVTSEDGRLMHSWRVLILPYLGPREAELYREYRFDEPWNGPHNLRLIEHMPEVYQSNGDAAHDHTETTFLALVEGMSVSKPDRMATMREDWQPIVVSVPDCRVTWLEPRDISLHGAKGHYDTERLRAMLDSKEPTLFLCGFGAQSTEFDQDDIMRNALLALFGPRHNKERPTSDENRVVRLPNKGQ